MHLQFGISATQLYELVFAVALIYKLPNKLFNFNGKLISQVLHTNTYTRVHRAYRIILIVANFV